MWHAGYVETVWIYSIYTYNCIIWILNVVADIFNDIFTFASSNFCGRGGGSRSNCKYTSVITDLL